MPFFLIFVFSEYKVYMSNLHRAIEIAVIAHGNQMDKSGMLYILHPLRIMLQAQTEEEKILGAIHDVVEDVEEWTLERFRQEGFSERIISCLDNLTRRQDETYAEFIERCCQDILSIRVKLNDIADNMDITRLPTMEEKDLGRMKRYHRARLRLLEAKKAWKD